VGRKGRCGFNRLKVVDIDGLVRYAVEGYGCNVGDSFIMLSSDLTIHHNFCFVPPPRQPARGLYSRRRRVRRCRFVVPMLKRPLARTPELQNAAKLYNKGWVRVEHSIGRERARFPSLRCIPVFVKDAASHLLAIQWCVACSVLHNIATIHRDPSFEPNPGFDDIVPPPPPLHVPLVPSEKQLEDLGDGMEGTL
jgi:hypothetical protein